MNNNQRKQKSYFEQQRISMNDPNFYKALTDQELRRQVKRIIRDIKNGSIAQQDMIYFKEPRIISACISVSYEESRKAGIITEALKYYNDTELSKYPLSPNNSYANTKRKYCTDLYTEMCIKANVWNECWRMFDAISKEPNVNNIPYMLNYICNINSDWFRYL